MNLFDQILLPGGYSRLYTQEIVHPYMCQDESLEACEHVYTDSLLLIETSKLAPVPILVLGDHSKTIGPGWVCDTKFQSLSSALMLKDILKQRNSYPFPVLSVHRHRAAPIRGSARNYSVNW